MLTYAIIIATCAVSLIKMEDFEFKNKFMFNAYAIDRYKQWWRFLTHGLLHADFTHLFFNMLSLFFFGPLVENAFQSEWIFGETIGKVVYLALYIGALVMSSMYSFFKHRNNSYYNALGASGAVSAVIYTAILLSPHNTIYLYFIPIPAWAFGVVYLALSWYLGRRGQDNIGHDAHFWGAVFGLVFPIVCKPALFEVFIFQLMNPSLIGN